MGKTTPRYSDEDRETALRMAKAGASMGDIASALGRSYSATKEAMLRWRFKLKDLPWLSDGAKGRQLRNLHAKGKTVTQIARAIGCSDATVKHQLKRLKLTPNKWDYAAAAKASGFGLGKHARTARVAKSDRVADHVAAVPAHAMNVQRAPWPSGCCQVVNDPANWAAVQYCNAPLADGDKHFCAEHNPFRPVQANADEMASAA